MQQHTEIALENHTDLELEIIAKCDKLLEGTDFTVKKIKKVRSIKYCLMLEGYDILCTDNIIDVHKFCKNKKDIDTLAITGKAMVENYKNKEASNV